MNRKLARRFVDEGVVNRKLARRLSLIGVRIKNPNPHEKEEA